MRRRSAKRGAARMLELGNKQCVIWVSDTLEEKLRELLPHTRPLSQIIKILLWDCIEGRRVERSFNNRY